MTATTVHPGRTETAHLRFVQAGSVAAGLAILLARPVVVATVGWSAPVVITVFGVVLVLALVTPVLDRPAGRCSSIVSPLAILLAGVALFAVGQLLAGGNTPAPATAALVSLNTLAAISEEALFRRVAFALFAPAGPVVAVAAPAMLFALAHVTVYGWWAFPLDMAAGLILGWQRWATGSWWVPAATHAVADLLVVI